MSILVAGCADSRVRRRGEDGGLDGSADCTPACASDEVCISGTCVPPATDGDGDGVPAAVDCNDSDPTIGRVADRPCTGTCGVGLEPCTDGVWGACDALGECTPGASETGAACGNCGTQERTCSATCTWGAYTCVDGPCAPGQTETEAQSCGNCNTGTQSRTRTCDGTCSWGTWSDYSTCAGGGTCAPGDTLGGCDRSSTGTATNCGVQVCSGACTWSACQLAPGAQCMSEMGGNYQCCTPSGGGTGWQFCNAPTCTWYSCASHACP